MATRRSRVAPARRRAGDSVDSSRLHLGGCWSDLCVRRAPSISRRRDIRQRCSLTGRIGRPVSKPLRGRRSRRSLFLRAVHLVGALVRSVAAGAGTRPVRGSERHSRLLHRLLHQEPDGSWTWRVRGAKVPATRTTDVCLLIEPAAATHYCPDCLLGAVRWDASGYVPRALECRDCGSQFALACLRTEVVSQLPGANAR